MRRSIAQASFVGVLCFAPFAPALARECQGRSDVPAVNLLRPPPCETCAETKAEINNLRAWSGSVHPSRKSRSPSMLSAASTVFLKGPVSPTRQRSSRPCERFFTMPRQEEKAAVERAKDTFCRTRPFRTPGNPLHPVQEARPDDSFSYPSGHAAYGAVIGFLLVEMLPEKRAEIYRRIHEYARARMIAGVHFRSDIEAGKLMGAAVVASLFAKPDFRPALDRSQNMRAQGGRAGIAKLAFFLTPIFAGRRSPHALS